MAQIYYDTQCDVEFQDGPDESQDLSSLFSMVTYTEKDDPSKLKKRTYLEYSRQVNVIDTCCVVQWPYNQTDESLIRRGRNAFEGQECPSLFEQGSREAQEKMF